MTSPWTLPRTRRIDPRLLDAALIAGCLLLTVMAVKTPWSTLPRPLIAGCGLAGSLAVGLRRSRPGTLAGLGAGTMALTGNPGPLVVGLFASLTATPRRPYLEYPALALAGVAGFAASDWLNEGRLESRAILAGALLTGLVMAAGTYTSTRHRLVTTLRERAEQAEAEHRLRDEQARAGERNRIAREMHDVLAHKVSLISLHAGALEVNAGAGAERIEQGAALIRATAQEALAELRTVLGVLRTPATDEFDDDRGAFADLAGLIETWTRAGATVSLHDETGPLTALTARTVYRLVQEGLTNAHRHAPGAPVSVTLTGRPDQEITVTVQNGPARQPGRPETGSGVGLVGLAERLRLAGGSLHSGPDGVGGWRLEGRLPGEGAPGPSAPAARRGAV
jgi:signal transduction histidine kinase